MRKAGFYFIILLANIIQGITGFAGTILAMPASVLLVGEGVARPVLNVLGLLSGVYVFAGNRKSVDRGELGRILPVMTAGILAGLGIRALLAGKEKALYLALGGFVLVLAARGLYRQLAGAERRRRQRGEAGGEMSAQRSVGLGRRAGDLALLLGAGVAHGIFVSGGPLLIGYLTGRLRDKTVFRATISTVWIVLNSLILLGDIREGLWNADCLRTLAVAVPFLTGGMLIGGRLYRIMSQRAFLILTYVLLALSGGLLFFKV
ncbi:MAG: sulfite exporter TauE/SafE family protein [Roseburia sp.]|nr:sulfite exporter TauE/SafE family protein [Roseburia sp.]MCM1097525.1 sulfite exporter TauE/SafE family protein [Ruminococcus flavefaciens]